MVWTWPDLGGHEPKFRWAGESVAVTQIARLPLFMENAQTIPATSAFLWGRWGDISGSVTSAGASGRTATHRPRQAPDLFAHLGGGQPHPLAVAGQRGKEAVAGRWEVKKKPPRRQGRQEDSGEKNCCRLPASAGPHEPRGDPGFSFLPPSVFLASLASWRFVSYYINPRSNVCLHGFGSW